MKCGGFSGIVLLLTLLLSPYTIASEAPYLKRVKSVEGTYDAVVDTRPLSSCRAASLQGASCLPVEDVLAPQRRLANWSGILWLLGSAKLSGHEHVLVIGQQAARREFMAGLLVLAGQRQVTVLDQPVSGFITNADQNPAGAPRSTTRTSVYTAQMRSDLIVLRSELAALINGDTVVLDGRLEAEYYGVAIRTARGGHIPGATHSPLASWRAGSGNSADIYKSVNPVTYAHDTFDSLVYFSALHAAGVSARVYLNGWVGWASDGALPVDSASYPRSAVIPEARSDISNDPAVSITRKAAVSFVFGALLITLGMLAVAFYGGRKFEGSSV